MRNVTDQIWVKCIFVLMVYSIFGCGENTVSHRGMRTNWPAALPSQQHPQAGRGESGGGGEADPFEGQAGGGGFAQQDRRAVDQHHAEGRAGDDEGQGLELGGQHGGGDLGLVAHLDEEEGGGGGPEDAGEGALGLLGRVVEPVRDQGPAREAQEGGGCHRDEVATPAGGLTPSGI